MKIFKHIFGKKHKGNMAEEVPMESVTEDTHHDYGLNNVGIALSSNDYGWNIKPYKQVILVNPKDCENKISVMSMVSAWRGTGHSEWEFLLAKIFVEAVVDAIENNKEEANITNLFNRDFLSSGDHIFSQKEVYDHLIPWFEIVEETDDELKLKIRIS